jgi:hypothetical protein
MKSIDPRICSFLEGAPIFFQPWWLEAVSPGCWDYVTIFRGDEVAAILPYTFKRRLKRFLLIEMPPLTPYMGPWLRPSTAKYANRISEQKELMSALIDGLPRFASFQHAFHPNITNWLPFYWRGFSQTTLYTYRIEDTADLTALWKETRDNVRTDIRKAEKQVTVEETTDVEEFLRVHRLTFSRQNKSLPHSEDVVRRVDSECERRAARKILLARDRDGRTHAAIYLVSDKKNVFYLLGGGDPKLRNSGATSLLIWRGISWAAELGGQFDFEGSIVEHIERFVRSFGARQVPYFNVEKRSSRVVTLYRALWKLTHTRNSMAGHSRSADH